MKEALKVFLGGLFLTFHAFAQGEFSESSLNNSSVTEKGKGSSSEEGVSGKKDTDVKISGEETNSTKSDKKEGESQDLSFEEKSSLKGRLQSLRRSFHQAGFSLSGKYSYSRKLIEISEGENSDSSFFSYSLSYKKLKPWSFLGSVGFFNDRDIVVDESRQLFLSHAGVSMSREPLKKGALSFQPSLSFRLPFGRYDWVSESLYLGVQGGLSMPFPKDWMPQKVSGSVGFQISKNFHKFDTRLLGGGGPNRLRGGPNTEWSFGLSGSLGYSLNKYISLNGSGGYGMALTYTPEAREYFSFGQSISASYKNVNFSVGHSLQSSVYAPDGVNYNVRIFDRDYSQIFASLGVDLIGKKVVREKTNSIEYIIDSYR